MRRPSTRSMPRPFLKWAGGKRSLSERILGELPDRIDLYIEPFLGGGAIFFALARERRFRRAILNDRNAELIGLWRVVQTDVDALIARVGAWRDDEKVYYQVRDELNRGGLSALEAAARTLWLNRHCYNGLYRRSRRTGFNVPYGRHASTPRFDAENLRACSAALQGVELVSEDFAAVLERAGPTAVVYCDPPYAPVSRTASFNNYDGLSFVDADQERLAAAFRALPDRGVRHAVLSNSFTEFTRSLYDDPRLKRATVDVRRNINRDAQGRAAVAELLVTLDPNT